MDEIILSEINIYPIKSLGGISLNEAVVENEGLRFDRRWMLVDENGKFFTQREFPRMATLRTAIENDQLIVSDSSGQISIPLNDPTPHDDVDVVVWNSSITAETSAGMYDEWFSDVLQTKCRLVRLNQNSNRLVNPKYAIRKLVDTVSFADGYPFLLICESSLNDLNSRLEQPVPMNRFRPNLVVSNAEPFADDNWKTIRIGETLFHLVKPCERCVMTTIDQASGTHTGKEPLKTLSTYRLVSGESKILFGQNLIADTAGATLKVGDPVKILEANQ